MRWLPDLLRQEMTEVLSDAVKAGATEQIPMKHFGTTEDIAGAVAFWPPVRLATLPDR